MNIGFIGVGAMGQFMAANLIKKGYTVYAYDALEANLERACAEGAIRTSSPAEVAEQAEVIITMLPETKDTEAVLLEEGGILSGAKEGLVIVDMGTGAPLQFKKLSDALAEKGITLFDSPVSGGMPKAKTGELSLMVSGPEAAFQKCKPILECMATDIFYVSTEVGIGQVIKLLNNMLSNSYLVLLCEVLVLGKKCGLSPHMLVDIFNKSAGQSYATSQKAPHFILKRNFKPGFKVNLTLKDLGLATALAREKKVPTPMVSTALQYYLTASAAGKGELDNSSVITLLEELTGTVVE